VYDRAGGKVNFKNDDSGNLHQIIGKTDFDDAKLLENFTSLMEAVNQAKPATLKKTYIASITINSTMGPGITVKI
jgi:large subunit ribosomal protein L1